MPGSRAYDGTVELGVAFSCLGAFLVWRRWPAARNDTPRIVVLTASGWSVELKMMKPTLKRAHEGILGPVVRSLTSFEREKGGFCGKAVRVNLW